jgi:glycosyltransferase involved in cell wall biosynthesis
VPGEPYRRDVPGSVGTDNQGPIRVVVYTDSLPGGSQASLATLVGFLGDSIDLTVMGTSEARVADVATARPGTATCVVPAVRSKFDVRSIGAHVRAIRRLRPDVLHVSCDNPWSAPYGLLAGVLTRTPTIGVVHGPAPAWRRRQQMLVRRLAPAVDAYVSVSRSSATATAGALGLAAGSVRTIYNGVRAPTLPPITMGAPATVERLPGTEPVVAGTGRFSPEKGFDVLIQAMGRLPRARLVLFGDGEERSGLEALATRLGLADRVHFAGWVPSPWNAGSQIDVLAVPSRSEGFGIALVEAMLARIPVVASEVGGIPEIVEHERTGLLVPVDDALALSKAIERLLDSPQLRERLVDGAEAMASARYAPEAMAAAYEALYTEVLTDRASKRQRVRVPRSRR